MLNWDIFWNILVHGVNFKHQRIQISLYSKIVIVVGIGIGILIWIGIGIGKGIGKGIGIGIVIVIVIGIARRIVNIIRNNK